MDWGLWKGVSGFWLTRRPNRTLTWVAPHQLQLGRARFSASHRCSNFLVSISRRYTRKRGPVARARHRVSETAPPFGRVGPRMGSGFRMGPPRGLLNYRLLSIGYMPTSAQRSPPGVL